MALKVKAVERLLKFDKESAGKYRCKYTNYYSITLRRTSSPSAHGCGRR